MPVDPGPSDWTRAINAIMPPSPSLSVRITNVTYFTETTSVRVHTISDTTP